ncbi:hypothetical protein PZ938_16635 [Luteipulveratus sp. YIM 133132]|uniref:DUF6318 family protein n=1 Tax=Luteipulveratus flavus TaxID=3031728 RepID=UPI0023AFE345|nr:DUF6318 family protein [Luteipulveratus sp. YIM 133132]MDE9367248.1 hypothetical protein [Luteipulveratus sp. YIM 133132]
MLSRSVRTTAAAAVLAVASAGVLSGCGGDDAKAGGSPTAASSLSTASMASSSATPSTSSAPSSSALGPGLPGVPANARANTTDAAIAFTQHYFGLVNRVRMQPKSGSFDGYGLPSCKSCAALNKSAHSLAENGQRLSSPLFGLTAVSRIAGETGMALRVNYDQPKVSVIEADGTSSRSEDAKAGASAVVFLQWSPAGWRISKIQTENRGNTP